MRKPLQEFIVGNTYRILPVKELSNIEGVVVHDSVKEGDSVPKPLVLDLPSSAWLFFTEHMECLCGNEFLADCVEKYSIHIPQSAAGNWEACLIAPWMCQEVADTQDELHPYNLRDVLIPEFVGEIFSVRTNDCNEEVARIKVIKLYQQFPKYPHPEITFQFLSTTKNGKCSIPEKELLDAIYADMIDKCVTFLRVLK